MWRKVGRPLDGPHARGAESVVVGHWRAEEGGGRCARGREGSPLAAVDAGEGVAGGRNLRVGQHIEREVEKKVDEKAAVDSRYNAAETARCLAKNLTR